MLQGNTQDLAVVWSRWAERGLQRPGDSPCPLGQSWFWRQSSAPGWGGRPGRFWAAQACRSCSGVGLRESLACLPRQLIGLHRADDPSFPT